MRISDENIRNYEIKTTSNMILDKYNKVNNKSKFRLGISISSFIIVALSIILIIVLIPKKNSPKNIPDDIPSDDIVSDVINVDEEVLNFQVSSLVSLISNTNATKVNSLMYSISNSDFNTNLLFSPFVEDNNGSFENNDDYFNRAIEEYQLFEDVIYNKYYKIEEEFTYNYNDYKGEYNDYKLMLGFNKYEIYINYTNIEDDESEFEGEINIDGVIYRIEGKEERESDELELSTKIYISEDEYYQVKEEYEDDEYSYKFSIKSKNKDKSEYKLKIEDEKISFKIDSNDKRLEYDIRIKDENNWEIGFNDSDNKFNFFLEVDDKGNKNYKKN